MPDLDCEKITNHIIEWLNDYISTIPMKGFVVGLSGGIDSALVAALCVRTGKDVVLLNMPIRQASSEYDRAQNQISSFENIFSNAKGVEVDLTSTFDAFVEAMPSKTGVNKLAMANSRARLRMTTLYAIGQANNLLVVGTGNKIEDFGIGFFTKYGDGGVDLNPIGDLLKSEVFRLAKHLDVNEEILEAKPTDGLWGDERNDEDQIGATYDELEFAMSYNGDRKDLSDRQKQVLDIYTRLNSINQHKMKPIPFCDLSKVR
ncbi:MAG TPA: NAD(+) synthase [Brumimicrobium sp.]|nr:NAD(+) synthase [Brumimicrobium sp.]